MEPPSKAEQPLKAWLSKCWSSPSRKASTVLLVAAVTAIGWQLRPKPESTPSSLSPRQVTALGRLMPEGGLVTLSTAAGNTGGSEVVQQWLVKEGDSIRPGELLGRLSSWEALERSAAQAKAQLRSAQDKYAQTVAGSSKGERIKAKSELISQQALLPYLQISDQKAQQLYEKGAISEEELGKARSTLLQAQAKIKGLQGGLLDATTVRKVDLDVAASDVASADAASKLATVQQRNAEIRSPLNGKLIRIYSWPGMKETDQGLAVAGTTNRMQVWAKVYQSDVAKLQLGETATITAESGGFSGQIPARLTTIVGEVSPKDIFAINANNDVNARVVLVKLNLSSDQSAKLSRLSGLNVTVRFDSAKR